MLISHAFCSLAYGLIPSLASAALDGPFVVFLIIVIIKTSF
jgi:hypothetical protein